MTSQPESLAWHAAACGDWLRAARALLSAADEAFRRFAVTDSAALATQALEAAQRAGDREADARARVIRGRAHEAMAELPAALADFSEGAAAARAVGDRRLEMLALRQLGGDVPVACGMPIGYCESHLAEGLRLAELLGDQAAAADLLARLAIITTNRLQFDLALDYGQRAVAAGRAASDGHALAAGLDGLKTAHAYLGHTDALATVVEELEPLLRRQGDLFRLQHAVFESAFVALAAGDWDQAIAGTESAIEINRRSGYPHWAGSYVAHLAWLARLRGRDSEAVSLGRHALRLSEVNGHPWGGALACAALGAALLTGGSRAEAIELFERGHATAREGGAEAYLLRCLAPLAEATGSPEILAEADRLLAGARLPAGDRPVPEPGEPPDLLDHLGVVIGRQRRFPLAAVGHRQPADEVGQPGVGRPFELGILVQEIVHVPGLVAHPEVVMLVGDQVGEHHEIADHDLVHPPGRLEHVQIVFGAFVLEMP